ncbi:hypothetical protein [Kocuria rosea]|uniref:hypothetical protein n=2 Tax=Micrococcaceae TaxID=1268 RepID=UPI000D6534E6|nr:hypothetical protein [Kocuria rosea]PWF83790.1 hypothetical protein DEJ37_13705 [Kocuria rosea]STX02274.1 Uncharacterised protein [Kocuria rosea]
MSVTIIRQWTGRGARYYHYDTVEEATEDTRDFIVRNVGPDIDPQQLEAITRGVVALHCMHLDFREDCIVVEPGHAACCDVQGGCPAARR